MRFHDDIPEIDLTDEHLEKFEDEYDDVEEDLYDELFRERDEKEES